MTLTLIGLFLTLLGLVWTIYGVFSNRKIEKKDNIRERHDS